MVRWGTPETEYELVQVTHDGNYISLKNAACSIYSNFTYYLVSCTGRHEEYKTVIMTSFFVQDLGLTLVARTCPRRPQAFKKVNNGHAFP